MFQNRNRAIKANFTDIRAAIAKKIDDIKATLESDTKRARKIIADVMGEIKITEKDENICTEYDRIEEKLLLVSGNLSPHMVAGAGFEPTTFGL